MNLQHIYRRFRAPFIYADLHIRFLGNRQIPHRFRTWCAYMKIAALSVLTPRRTKPIKALGYELHYGSLYFLRPTFREIFIERLYAPREPAAAKRIIDGGANIGISMLYYKQRFPEAEIICFEPDPSSYRVLKANIERNGLKGVSAHNAALADKAGKVDFHFHSDKKAGDTFSSTNKRFRAAYDAETDLEASSVDAVELRPYLKQPLDILKLDIEGAEGEVIRNVSEVLDRVGVIQMEYHFEPAANPLIPILEALEKSGHHFEIHAPEPLQQNLGGAAMIYASKD